jgi:hypothetical protein
MADLQRQRAALQLRPVSAPHNFELFLETLRDADHHVVQQCPAQTV